MGLFAAAIIVKSALGWDAAEWEAAGTWVTALIALMAAFYAGRQVLEIRRSREAESQPFVIVTLEPSERVPQLIMLRVENIGDTLARDVRFEFSPPLISVMTAGAVDDLADSRLVREGLPMMPPGMRLDRVFDDALGWGDGGSKQPVLTYDVTVTFKDYRGRAQDPLTYVVDLRPYMDGSYLESKSIHHVAAALDDLSKLAAKGGINVLARDADARDARQREQNEATHARLKQRRQAKADGPTQSEPTPEVAPADEEPG